MSKHTPGPWIADAWVGTDPYDDPDGPFVEIGSVRWSPNKVDVPAAIEQTANARLIAAAPDLLEALELALGSHNRFLMSDPPKDAWVFNGVEAKAREVIAKIKGEE